MSFLASMMKQDSGIIFTTIRDLGGWFAEKTTNWMATSWSTKKLYQSIATKKRQEFEKDKYNNYRQLYQSGGIDAFYYDWDSFKIVRDYVLYKKNLQDGSFYLNYEVADQLRDSFNRKITVFYCLIFIICCLFVLFVICCLYFLIKSFMQVGFRKISNFWLLAVYLS